MSAIVSPDIKPSALKTCCLLVVYNPDPIILREVLESLRDQICKVYVFNNGDENSVLSTYWDDEFIHVMGDGENIGIAAAQNRLLELAFDFGFLFAVLSDQDSIYPSNYVDALLGTLADNDNAVGICGGWVDANLGEGEYAGQSTFNERGGLEHKFNRDEPFSISHAIASGLVIKLDLMIEVVGYMREDFFIDWVDNEWCWRACAKDLELLCDPRLLLHHKLGDSTKIILGRPFVFRNDIRNYFCIRNLIYMVLYLPWLQKSVRRYLVVKGFHHIVFSLLASEGRLDTIRFILKGIYDGVLRRMGPA